MKTASRSRTPSTRRRSTMLSDTGSRRSEAPRRESHLRKPMRGSVGGLTRPAEAMAWESVGVKLDVYLRVRCVPCPRLLLTCCLVLFGVVWCCLVLFGVVWLFRPNNSSPLSKCFPSHPLQQPVQRGGAGP